MTEQSLNRHQRRRLRTKRQLEQAAMECLIETGYDRLTIQDIVDRADLGRGTFYIHFHDKEEIVWANFQHGLEQEKTLSSQNIENLSGQETLLSSLNTIFQHADQHR